MLVLSAMLPALGAFLALPLHSTSEKLPPPLSSLLPRLQPRTAPPHMMAALGKSQTVAQNKIARRNYEILEDFEAGISLVGTEVKSLRQGKCTLRDGYCRFSNGECWLHNVNIGRHSTAGGWNHEETRTLQASIPSFFSPARSAIPQRASSSPTSHNAPSSHLSLFALSGPRRLLLHKKEIIKLQKQVDEKGLTVVPLAAYFNDKSFLKINLGLARGKKLQDKRAALKGRDIDRDTVRSLKNVQY